MRSFILTVRWRLLKGRIFDRGWIWHEDDTWTSYVRVLGRTVRERSCGDPFADIIPGGLSRSRACR